MSEEPYLNATEAAEILRISAYTVREWAKSGKLRGVKAGWAWLFKRSDVMKLLEEGAEPKKTE